MMGGHAKWPKTFICRAAGFWPLPWTLPFLWLAFGRLLTGDVCQFPWCLQAFCRYMWVLLHLAEDPQLCLRSHRRWEPSSSKNSHRTKQSPLTVNQTVDSWMSKNWNDFVSFSTNVELSCSWLFVFIGLLFFLLGIVHISRCFLWGANLKFFVFYQWRYSHGKNY